MKKKQKHSETSRRWFLNISLLAGFSVLFSGRAKAKSPKINKKEEKVRMITSDGQVLEVDKSRIPNFGKVKPVSEKEFEEWKVGRKQDERY